MVSATKTNNELNIKIAGRLESGNAEETWGLIKKELDEQQPYEKVVLDAEGLEYISSAGLRVVLRIKKLFDNFEVVNVNSDVYEIFEMTSFTEIMDIKKSYRKFTVSDDCPVIGKGAKGTVYRVNDDTIIKVYNSFVKIEDIQREVTLAKKAFVLGIPTAISFDIVKVGDRLGSMFELLDATSFTDMIKNNPGEIDKYLEMYAGVLRQINMTDVSKEGLYDYKEMGYVWLDTAAKALSKDIYDRVRELIDEIEDRQTMLHCDYHTNNLLYQNGEALLIDMDTLAHGHPIFELANIYITYVGFGVINPKIVEDFLEIPYDTAKLIWEKFLPLYLKTDDPVFIESVENKTKLLAYLRLLRHTIRRAEKNGYTEESTKTVEYSKAQIEELLKVITTLNF